MLDIRDPVIANCLVDERRVEHVLLATTVDAGVDLMTSGRTEQFNELYTINGDQIFSQPCFRLYNGNNGGKARLLTVNLEQSIAACKLDKRQFDDSIQEKKELIAQAELEMRRSVQVS